MSKKYVNNTLSSNDKSKAQNPFDILAELKSTINHSKKDNYIIHTIANKKFIIESYKGIIEYTDKTLCIKTKLSTVTLKGSNLEIKNMSDDVLFITGDINQIIFE